MIHSKNGFKISYDPEADVLYVTRGELEYTDYVEYAENVILRFEPGTKRLVGFTLIDFSQHFAQQKPDIRLPFESDFQVHEEMR
ncbi:DUF2283 domain-containing protein [Candidatus Poribacteria bacterium]|nr:DUF2283 domain-containing protein [Candidatus Poribacteria bacterium]